MLSRSKTYPLCVLLYVSASIEVIIFLVDSLNEDGADEIGVVSVRSGPMAVINRSDEDDDQNNSEDLSEIDTLQDAEENKDVYRLKVVFTVNNNLLAVVI